MKIRSKFLLFFIGWLVLMCVPTISLFYYHGKNNIKLATEEKINYSAENFKVNLGRFLEDRSFEISYLSKRIETISQWKGNDYLTNMLLDSKENLKKYVVLSIYDQNHKKIVDTNNAGVNSIFPWFFWNATINSDRPYLSHHYDPVLKDHFLLVAKRVKLKNQTGIILAHISMDFVHTLLTDFKNPLNRNVDFLVDLVKQDGEIIYSNNSVDWIMGKSAKDLNLVNMAQISHNSIQTISPETQALSHTLKLLNDEEWNLIVHFDPKHIYADVKTYTQSMIGFFLISLIIAGIVANYSAKTLAVPIEKLTNDLQKVSIDNLESFNPSDYHGSKEIREVAVKISEMIFHLEVGLRQFHQKSRLQDLGEMAGGIAHEINNPLTVIEGRSKQIASLIAKNAPPEEINKCLDSIKKTTTRIAEIIKNLRNLTRNAEDDILEAAPLKTIINSTLEVCNSSLIHKKIQLTTKFANEEIVLMCRQVQISQIILNLINNACDAVLVDTTSSKRWIQIETKQDKDWVYIEVINSGAKIPTELAHKLFRPFFTTKAPGHGTGIGLSLSRSFAHKNNGDLSLDLSRERTVFVLKLPRNTNDQKAA